MSSNEKVITLESVIRTEMTITCKEDKSDLSVVREDSGGQHQSDRQSEQCGDEQDQMLLHDSPIRPEAPVTRS